MLHNYISRVFNEYKIKFIHFEEVEKDSAVKVKTRMVG